jgi:predicted nucleotidyltransferase
MEADEALKLAAEILRREGAKEVYVFGSVAQGSACADSDLDLAVRGLDWLVMLRLIAELPAAVGRSVDIVSLDESDPFARHLEEKIAKGWARRVA